MTNKLVSKRELEISLTMRPVWELKDLFNLLDHMPLVDGGFTRHGHWVYVGHGLAGESICKCSICGHQTPDDGNYCSYCGAKMDEEKAWIKQV